MSSLKNKIKEMPILYKITYPFYKIVKKTKNKLRSNKRKQNEYLLEQTNLIRNIQEEVNALEVRIGTIESQPQVVNQTSELLEHRLGQLNFSTNQLLYEMQLALDAKSQKENKKFAPLVSIVIPVYNGSNYLKEAIDSALTQTYKNIEVIVVNDGSKDDDATEKIAKSYKNKIRYYKKENGGVSSALNYGIKKMDGEYFAWLSHDDLFAPTNIEEHVRYLKNTKNKNVITYTGFNLIDENGNPMLQPSQWARLYLYDYKMSLTDPFSSLLQGEINGDSVLIPKKIFEEFGLFDENDVVSQERDMWIRILKKYTFVSIPYITTSIRMHSKQVSNQRDDILEKSNIKRLEILKIVAENIKDPVKKKEFYLEMACFYRLNVLKFLEEEANKLAAQINVK